jgi:hypothetical protein
MPAGGWNNPKRSLEIDNMVGFVHAICLPGVAYDRAEIAELVGVSQTTIQNCEIQAFAKMRAAIPKDIAEQIKERLNI